MPRPAPEVRRLRPSFVGVAGLACVLFLVLGSAPALHAGWTLGLCALWLALFVAAMSQFTARPRLVGVLPLLGVAGWLVGVLVQRG